MSLQGNLRELRRLREQVERQLGSAGSTFGGQAAMPGDDARPSLTPPEAFGRRIHQLRLEHGLKLEDVAQATGISKAYLSQVENGRVDPPRDDKVRRLEELFGQRPQSLVEIAHLAAAPEDVRRRLQLLKSAFERAEETVGLLMAHVDPATVQQGESCGEPAGETEISPGNAGEGAAGEGGRAAADTAAGATIGKPGGAAGSEKSCAPDVQSVSKASAETTAGPAASSVSASGSRAGANVGGIIPIRKAVPIINRVAAGYPAEFTDLGYPVGVADDYISMPPGLEDPGAFAVHVVGDSMEPRYHAGDIVVFSPRADIRSGDDCYVRFATGAAAGEGATFKRIYFDDEKTIRLQPLNDKYPPTLVPSDQVDGMYRAMCRYERL